MAGLEAAPQTSKESKAQRDIIISRLREMKQRLAAGDTTAILPALKLIEEAEALE